MTAPRRVFVSFAHQDAALAVALRDALTSHGVVVPPRELGEIVCADAFLVLVTGDSLEDATIEKEVTFALGARIASGEPAVLAIARGAGEKSVRRLFGAGPHADPSAPAVLTLAK